jgi:hypothetical protein
MATPEKSLWKKDNDAVLQEMGFTGDAFLRELVIGQREINGRFYQAMKLILEAIADPNNPDLQKAKDFIDVVPGRIPPGCSDPH